MTLPDVSPPQGFLFATFAIALIAAAFDWRTQRIPNAVTLSGLLLSFPLHAWLSPAPAAYQSLSLGCAICTVPALVAWRLGWLAGGDVKLLAAMGALGGISFGLEAVFLSFFCAMGFIFLRLLWNGAFLHTAANGVAVAATRTFIPVKRVKPVAEFSSHLRFGPFALAGATLSLVMHGASL